MLFLLLLTLGSGLVSALPALVVLSLGPTASPRNAVLIAGVTFSVALVLLVTAVHVGFPRLREALSHAKDRSPTVVILGFFVSLLVGAAIVFFYWNSMIVHVPNFVGKTEGDTKLMARELGLILSALRADQADDFTRVTHQEPPPGTKQMHGASVDIVVGVLNCSIEITDPVDGATVTTSYLVQGTSKGIAESDGRLRGYLLLHPLQATGYWVFGPLTVGEDGKWRYRVLFGVPGGPTEDFELAVLVTKEGLKAEGSAGGPPEYEALPPYVAIGKSPIVTRE